MRPEPARSLKSLLFALVGGVFFALALGLSAYKVAVANAFLRLGPTAAEAVPEPAPGQSLSGAGLRGRHLAQLMGCRDCHGHDLAGRVLADDPARLVLVAPNITPHATARVAGWSAGRWYAALAEGVDGEGRALWGMPRGALLQLAQQDVLALASYLQNLPAKPSQPAQLPQSRLGGRGYLAVALRQIQLVDRTPLRARAAPSYAAAQSTRTPTLAARPAHAPAVDGPAGGRYLLAVGQCLTCHRARAAGDGAAPPPPLEAPGLAPPRHARPAPALDVLLADNARPAKTSGFPSFHAKMRRAKCRAGDGAPYGAGDAAPGRLAALDATEANALWRALAAQQAAQSP